MKITIETIPHEWQRYNTVGDWYLSSTRIKDFDQKGTLNIRVSIMSDWRFEALVALHELIEALLCARAGITPKQVDDFDLAFEAKRKPGDKSEPGDDPLAPYFAQHQAAGQIEREFAGYLGVNWEAYKKEVDSL